jgi:hypothetical protein
VVFLIGELAYKLKEPIAPRSRTSAPGSVGWMRDGDLVVPHPPTPATINEWSLGFAGGHTNVTDG